MTLPAWISDGSDIPDPFGYGQRAVDFLRLLKHPKSRQPKRAFELPDWQERIVRRIYGPCTENGRRIVRNVIILLPRGNRKTSLGAALGLLHTIGPERENGGQANIAAADRKQARIAYEEAEGILKAEPRPSTEAQQGRQHDPCLLRLRGQRLPSERVRAGCQIARKADPFSRRMLAPVG